MTLGPRVVVVGPGRVGGSLAAALAAAGTDVELRGRAGTAPPAPEVAPDVDTASGPPAADDPPFRTLVFAVPDDDLEAAVGAWAGATGEDAASDAGSSGPGADGRPPGGPGGPDASSPGAGSDRPVALHTSGVRGPEALAPLRSAGWAAGGWHPLAAVGEVAADAFRGHAVGLSGSPAAVERGRELAEVVGARCLAVDEGAHARYHAAAVLASNGLVACLSAAREELAGATGGEGRLEDLLPLARAALGHVEARGLDGGLTGPVDRGDAGTVRRDMTALGRERAELYRRLARELLDLVGERLPADRRRALRELLEG